MTMIFKRLAAGAALAVIATMGLAETKVGTTVESRIMLGFKVDDAAIGEMLPEGWVSVTIPKGPVAGSNVIVAMMDQDLILNAEGKPDTPASNMAVALLAYARKDGVEGVRGFVTRVYEEPPIVDPYGTSVAADINHVTGSTTGGPGDRSRTETWTVSVEGGALSLELEYRVGGYGWAKGGESRPYSASDPEFFRIYRYDQLVSVLMNGAMGRELNGSVNFSVTDPALAKVFDGSETLTAILSAPVYIREISLP